jgi:hypothetical protein
MALSRVLVASSAGPAILQQGLEAAEFTGLRPQIGRRHDRRWVPMGGDGSALSDRPGSIGMFAGISTGERYR